MKKGPRSRRFIAGARCPNCGNIDGLFFVDDKHQLFACIDCHYHSSTLEEQAKQADDAVQKLNIIDATKKDGQTAPS